jgi:hypothetical protein
MSGDRRGLERFVDDAQGWRAGVGGRVPVYDRLLEAAAGLVEAPADAAERAARARLEAAWRERRFTAAYDRPLLLLAALRAEAFRAGPAHALHAALAAEPPRPEAVTRAALAGALADAPARLHVDLATRWVQTNETSRAVTWLWPAQLAGCSDGARPLALADVGCSAGLNLIGDALPPLWTDGGGQPLPTAERVRTVARLGLDARPLDVGRAEDAAWLRACVWPGEGARLARLDGAIAALRAAREAPGGPTLEALDVVEVPARLDSLAAGLPDDGLVLAYQTVVRDYLPPAVRTGHEQAMRAWIAGTRGPARVFVELEAPPETFEPPGGPKAVGPTPMALTAHVAGGAGGVETFVLARCGYHPTLVIPDPEAVASFARALARGRDRAHVR